LLHFLHTILFKTDVTLDMVLRISRQCCGKIPWTSVCTPPLCKGNAQPREVRRESGGQLPQVFQGPVAVSVVVVMTILTMMTGLGGQECSTSAFRQAMVGV
jgi:hypothetical protein